MVKNLAMLFGVVFLAIGVLGFVPGVTKDGHLLGVFDVGTLHNIIHLASGVAALWLASMGSKYAKMYFQVFGVVYGLVTIIGFVQKDNVFGLFDVNMADNVLHLVITAVALWAGFGMKAEEA